MRTLVAAAAVLLTCWAAGLAHAQGLDLSTTNGLLQDQANASTTGTTLYTLTKITAAGGIIAATTDTQGIRGVCVGGCGTTGNAEIAVNGTAPLLFDGTPTAGDFVQISSTTGGYGHDTGSATCPATGGQVIGKVGASGPSSTYYVSLGGFGCSVAAAGTTFTVTYTGHGTYTWTKATYPGITLVNAYCMGAGAGGASGAVSSSAGDGGGGGGGGAGALVVIPAALLGSTVTVTVGQGGAGGTAVTNTGNGNIGSAGGNSTFGSWATGYGGLAQGTFASTGGSTVTPTGQSGIPVTFVAGDFTGFGGGGGSGPSQGESSGLYGGAGGGGGGNSGTNGKTGGISPGELTPTVGGTSGATATNGGNGVNPSTIYLGNATGSAGAGGGDCTNASCTAGSGGTGGYGSGGGGGGNAQSATGTSGAGGAGGDGLCIISGS